LERNRKGKEIIISGAERKKKFIDGGKPRYPYKTGRDRVLIYN